MKTILLIDGDIQAYQNAAGCETRKIKALHKPSGKSKEFKNKTELKKALQAKGKTITDDYEIQDIQVPIEEEKCLNSLRLKIKNIVNKVEPDEYYVLLGGINNFRDNLPLPTKYKSSRKDNLRPVHLKACLEYMKESYRVPEINGHETDDELSIRGYESLEQGNKVIISTEDKDAYQGNGLYIFNENDSEEPFLIEELGSLYIKISGKDGKNKTVKGSGMKFLCFQWIFGDTSDGYSPYELSSWPFGQMAAYERLEACSSVKECLEVVIKTFKDFYPEPFEYKCWQGLTHKANWYTMLELYFKCCWMKRTPDDPSNPMDLFNKYEVTLKE